MPLRSSVATRCLLPWGRRVAVMAVLFGAITLLAAAIVSSSPLIASLSPLPSPLSSVFKGEATSATVGTTNADHHPRDMLSESPAKPPPTSFGVASPAVAREVKAVPLARPTTARDPSLTILDENRDLFSIGDALSPSFLLPLFQEPPEAPACPVRPLQAAWMARLGMMAAPLADYSIEQHLTYSFAPALQRIHRHRWLLTRKREGEGGTTTAKEETDTGGHDKRSNKSSSRSTIRSSSDDSHNGPLPLVMIDIGVNDGSAAYSWWDAFRAIPSADPVGAAAGPTAGPHTEGSTTSSNKKSRGGAAASMSAAPSLVTLQEALRRGPSRTERIRQAQQYATRSYFSSSQPGQREEEKTKRRAVAENTIGDGLSDLTVLLFEPQQVLHRSISEAVFGGGVPAENGGRTVVDTAGGKASPVLLFTDEAPLIGPIVSSSTGTTTTSYSLPPKNSALSLHFLGAAVGLSPSQHRLRMGGAKSGQQFQIDVAAPNRDNRVAAPEQAPAGSIFLLHLPTVLRHYQLLNNNSDPAITRDPEATVPLSQLRRRFGGRHISILKVDCEGADAAILSTLLPRPLGSEQQKEQSAHTQRGGTGRRGFAPTASVLSRSRAPVDLVMWEVHRDIKQFQGKGFGGSFGDTVDALWAQAGYRSYLVGHWKAPISGVRASNGFLREALRSAADDGSERGDDGLLGPVGERAAHQTVNRWLADGFSLHVLVDVTGNRCMRWLRPRLATLVSIPCSASSNRTGTLRGGKGGVEGGNAGIEKEKEEREEGGRDMGDSASSTATAFAAAPPLLLDMMRAGEAVLLPRALVAKFLTAPPKQPQSRPVRPPSLADLPPITAFAIPCLTC